MERLVRSLRARRVVGSSTPLISAMAVTGMGSVGVAEGGDDALFLGGEAGDEVAEDELEGIIALRATAQVGEGVGDGGKGTAADLLGGPGEEEGIAAGLGDEAEAVEFRGGGEGGVVAGDVGEALEGGGLTELLEFEPSAGGDDEGRLVRRALQVRGRWPRKAKRLRWSASVWVSRLSRTRRGRVPVRASMRASMRRRGRSSAGKKVVMRFSA